MLTTVRRVDDTLANLDVIARAFAAMLRHDGAAGAALAALPEIFPWVRFLPDDGVREFLDREFGSGDGDGLDLTALDSDDVSDSARVVRAMTALFPHSAAAIDDIVRHETPLPGSASPRISYATISVMEKQS